MGLREILLSFKRRVVGSHVGSNEFQYFNLNPAFVYEYINDLIQCAKSQVMWNTTR